MIKIILLSLLFLTFSNASLNIDGVCYTLTVLDNQYTFTNDSDNSTFTINQTQWDNLINAGLNTSDDKYYWDTTTQTCKLPDTAVQTEDNNYTLQQLHIDYNQYNFLMALNGLLIGFAFLASVLFILS
ncbi:MAG: hypothetical protein PHE73_03775 [Sulfurovaceae bacterium]|nr:hypothetical protein [Sulfurovaceae bacterium]